MTLQEIKRANANAGFHYFDRDTMSFFRSRVSDNVHSGPGGVFLVTSGLDDEALVLLDQELESIQ